MVAVDTITNVLASADKERKAIKFMINLKGTLMGLVAVLLSHRGGEGKGSGGTQRALLQDYSFLCKITATIICMASGMANVEVEITRSLKWLRAAWLDRR